MAYIAFLDETRVAYIAFLDETWAKKLDEIWASSEKNLTTVPEIDIRW